MALDHSHHRCSLHAPLVREHGIGKERPACFIITE